MSECSSCGAHVSPGEHFCGNCGAQITPSSVELRTVSAASLDDEQDPPQREGREWATTLDPSDETPVIPADSIHETSSSDKPREPSGSLETTYVAPDSVESSAPISSASLGGSFTDNIGAQGSTGPEKGTTGGHRPAVKQLPTNT